MSTPSIVKSFFITTTPPIPVALQVGESKILQIHAACSFKESQSVAQHICYLINNLFPNPFLSNQFLEPLSPAHLADERLFKAPLLSCERAVVDPPGFVKSNVPRLRIMNTRDENQERFIIGFLARLNPFLGINESDKLPEAYSKILSDTSTRNCLWSFQFDLGIDPSTSAENIMTHIQRFWNDAKPSIYSYYIPSKKAQPLVKYAPTIPLRSIVDAKGGKASSFIGEVPFKIPLDKIEHYLNLILESTELHLPYQSKPFTYPSITASAGAACSPLEKCISPLRSNPGLKDASNPEENGLLILEAVYKTLLRLSKKLYKKDYLPIPGLISKAIPPESDLKPAAMAAGAASSAAEKTIFCHDATARAIISPIPYPLLKLKTRACVAIFKRNIPDIARSMIAGVFESENPNQASLIRAELFINLLENSLRKAQPKHLESLLEGLSNLIGAIEEAISDLSDYEKICSRAKFLSLAFLIFPPPGHVNTLRGSTFEYTGPIAIKEHFFKIDKDTPIIHSASGAATPVTQVLYENALNKINLDLTTVFILNSLAHSILIKKDLNWERRKHLVASYSSFKTVSKDITTESIKA